jgi:hypothetical protein
MPRKIRTSPATTARAGLGCPNARGTVTRGLLVAVLLLGCAAGASAWGTLPHSWITSAAVDNLGPRHPLVRHLQSNADRLPTYCQMADWRRGLITCKGGESFYADDYLLFPTMPVHLEHDSPAVEETYRPYFRRAVQSLRTETPANAARWIGSLLHFVEDSGSPPHAFKTHGDLHVRMENWVDKRRIRLDGYRPQALGATEDQALEGFVRRMEGLIAYSRERGRKLRPLAEARRRAEAEPIELESALECSRVVADLLETLGQFVPAEAHGSATLRGMVGSSPAPGLESLPAKIMLEGTNFSTLADPSGAFEFRNLLPADYRMIVDRPGSEPMNRPLTLGAGATRFEDVVLPASDPPGNLVRNPRFHLHWIQRQVADHWYRVVKDGATSWESEPLPVSPGRRYRMVVHWKRGASGSALLLWCVSPPAVFEFDRGVKIDHNYGDKMTAEPPLTSGERERTLTAPGRARYALIVFRGADRPEAVCEGVALSPAPL